MMYKAPKAFYIQTAFVMFTPFSHGPKEEVLLLRNQWLELVYHLWECKMVQPLQKTIWFLKNLKIYRMIQQSTSGCIPKRCESWVSKKYLQTHVHSSIIYNS